MDKFYAFKQLSLDYIFLKKLSTVLFKNIPKQYFGSLTNHQIDEFIDKIH